MLYNLVKKYKGNVSVVMTDTYVNVNARKKALMVSQRKGVNRMAKVEYKVEPTDSVEKFQQRPHTPYGKNETQRN